MHRNNFTTIYTHHTKQKEIETRNKPQYYLIKTHGPNMYNTVLQLSIGTKPLPSPYSRGYGQEQVIGHCMSVA